MMQQAQKIGSWMKANKGALTLSVMLAVAALGLAALHGLLVQVRLHDVRHAVHAIAGWRLAVVQQLAREQAPRRINAVASDDPAAIERTCAWLESAPGVTGQYLPIDSHGASAVVC